MPTNHVILCHPFSSCFQSFPASGSLPMSRLFASGIPELQLQLQHPCSAQVFSIWISCASQPDFLGTKTPPTFPTTPANTAGLSSQSSLLGGRHSSEMLAGSGRRAGETCALLSTPGPASLPQSRQAASCLRCALEAPVLQAICIPRPMLASTAGPRLELREFLADSSFGHRVCPPDLKARLWSLVSAALPTS